MRSHEERVAEAKRRIAAREHEDRRRRDRLTVALAAAACLAVLAGVSFAMPGIAARIQITTTPALKRLPASFGAAPSSAISLSAFWPSCWVCA